MTGRIEHSEFIIPVSLKCWEDIMRIDFKEHDARLKPLLQALKEGGNAGVVLPGFSVSQLQRVSKKLEETAGYRLNLVSGTGPTSQTKQESRYRLMWAKSGKK